MKKRLISLFLAASLAAVQVSTAKAVKYFETNTIIEAEKANLNNGMICWEDETTSGGAVYSNAAVLESSDSITVEDLNFLFNVKKAGEYHIFIRCKFSSSQSSLFYRVDDGKWNFVDTGETEGFEWIELTTTELNGGIHKFSYNHAKRGGDIDAFYVTDDIKTVPEKIEGVVTGDNGEDDEEDEVVTNFVNMQKEIPVVTGNGILFEAEDCSYSNWYQTNPNKFASGGNTVKAQQNFGSGVGSTTRREFEFTFTVEKEGTYTIWVRAYASSGSQDSFYAGYAPKLDYMDISQLGEFMWIKSAAQSLKAGEQAVFRMYGRERGHLIDAIIVTPTGFTPTGRTGNFPKGVVKSQLVSKYAAPPYYPPSDHPRVLFTSADIPRIKENMEKPQNRIAYEKWQGLMDTDTDGNAGGRYNERMLREIEALAFDYVINGNRENGKRAVSAIVNYVNTVDPGAGGGNATRNGGVVIYRASEIYDWCYDLMTNAEKGTIIAKCEEMASKMEIKWPPDAQGSLVGHGAEAQLLRDTLAFAIATYNERPDIWETVGGRFYEEYTEGRDFFNKGHFALQGDGYGLYRHRWDTYSYLLITGMGLPSPYNVKDFASVAYSHIYMRRPDGQYLRDGDTADDTTYGMWEYWAGYGQTYIVDSAAGNDPYLKDAAFAMNPDGQTFESASPIIYLVANNPDLPKASVANLPKSKLFDDPAGVMVARTGWDNGADTNDVVVEMKIGGVRQNGHQHYDAGHFQIYYKGILASDSGVYQGRYNDNNAINGTGFNSPHRLQYMVKTIAHNSMLVYDPNESNGSGSYNDIADGGQRAVQSGGEPWKIQDILADMDEYRVATIEGHEIDPKNPVDPEYTYIKGELENAYTDKVKEFKRSFMFFNFFDDEVPAALVVFDKVTSSDSSFKKTWLLHGVEKPTVNGMQTVFSRTYQSPITPSGYNGKMTVDTLLPKESDANIEIIGGEEEGYSIINGKDFTGTKAASHVDEGDTYRMELSPKGQHETDYFLNVIQVSDNDKNYYLKPEIFENNLFYGVKIKDRAVLFSKSGARVEESFTVNLPSLCKVTVCDVKAGTWSVTANGETKSIVAGKDGGVLAFEASGNVSCSFLSEEGETVKTEVILGTEDEYRLRIEGQYVNGAQKPEVKDGKFMMPLTTLADWFGINRTYDNDKIILSLNDKTVEISTADSILKDGENAYDMMVAPYDKNGEIMVPARDLVEIFGGSIEWYPSYNLASIGKPPVDYSLPEGYAKVASVTPDSGTVDGGNVCDNAVDGNGDTIWAANGVGRYFDIELEKAETIDQIEVLFNPNGGRTAEFDILVSDDGETYTKILSSTSDGSLEGITWETYRLNKPVKTKYIRYKGNGSDISNWNAIIEIRFRKG